jgi:hypothetical protein
MSAKRECRACYARVQGALPREARSVAISLNCQGRIRVAGIQKQYLRVPQSPRRTVGIYTGDDVWIGEVVGMAIFKTNPLPPRVLKVQQYRLGPMKLKRAKEQNTKIKDLTP